MVKYCTYRILPEFNIIIEFYSGPVNLSDLTDIRNKLINEKLLINNFNFIVDLRNAVFDLHTNVVEEFISYVKQKSDLIWKRKTSIISLTPNQSAFSVLYISDLGNSPLKVNTFSTIESALKWVDLPPSAQPHIEKVIDEMKKQ